ncbi:MAG: diphthine--ammonia ligase [Nitrosopumilus sp. H8]|nr:MAG: diphthine--ammonia ligase [Nitrosopumilus sp. H13]RNJ78946.1 MAG: diphthine--ammonia ligase [Nitrosopumilus sp. H8]
MRLGALFSGGKDSTYAVHAAQTQGYEVACLLSILGRSEESLLLHHPNIRWTALQAQSMGIPQITAESGSDDEDEELESLGALLAQAVERFGIGGLVHGGIRSKFQRDRFGRACSDAGLELVSPLWGADPRLHMESLLDAGFEFLMSSVSAGGLDESWLGRTVTRGDLAVLGGLSERHGFNLDFEGGEAETFVTDCPLFSRPVRITSHSKTWDRYRGGFEILGAELG